MAKKTVATLQTGKEGRSYTKVIKMVKSPKTGAYVFDEQMVPNEKSSGLSLRNNYYFLIDKKVPFVGRQRELFLLFLFSCEDG